MIPPKHKPLEKNVSFGLELAAGFARIAGSPVCNLWSHKQRLDELGFDWEPINSLWEKMFVELKRYKDEHGDCNVPKVWRENQKLATWVSTQRNRHRKGEIAPDQWARLNALGFEWDTLDAVWEQRFIELTRYKKRFGHCNVPKDWAENPKLGAWVDNQRTRKGKLASLRKARLDALGFDWSPRANKRRAG
jgi:hypothetical protein